MKGKASVVGRRRSRISIVKLMLAILLPFLFLRLALFLIESASLCSSSFGCMGPKLSGGSESSRLIEQLTKALLEANNGDEVVEKTFGVSPESFGDLIKDVMSSKQDIKAFAFKTKAMIALMERKVQSARRHELIYWHLASHGVPKSLHCLHLKLAEEYAVNAIARSSLPSPEYVSRLTDPSFHHVLLLTDNVLAASVAITSAIKNSISPEKMVFHVVTDKKTYTPMHAWFAKFPVDSAVLEVKGLHQYDWSHEVNYGVKEMLEIHRLILSHTYENLKEGFNTVGYNERQLEFTSPRCVSLLNHLRIYAPELFPNLNKIIFLDDDVVVQHDLSALWQVNLNGKVVGAVFESGCGPDCCPGRKYKNYFNFSNSYISSNLNEDQCGWLYGMNVFNLEAWRNTNITATYHQWLKFNLDSGLDLWNPGALPPALLAFSGFVHPIHPSWHMAGLGYRFPQVGLEALKAATVLHFSGPAKPWLEIGDSKVRSLWTRHLNYSNEILRECRIRE
ncbi:hypothetical protein DCAR_0624993 [Daucus carota subsp. sativus]|uniref:Hexosyltransferase n=1 Tax=Daucus carota subsp. sativus TaxID=79200 RepID=A0AAF0XEZ6_DAUCS|nr:PREDICTED: probable galacturonosyltransferase 15 [Daucus carota subsp. sativus]WOH05574.1 hypothetical protein DCAR_0624993 [Daucus carota subsp. sativus]